MGQPRGQLSHEAPADLVSERIAGIAEAGEDCRQKLSRAGEKAKLREEVLAEINAERGGKK